jgi:hypothetical protein
MTEKSTSGSGMIPIEAWEKIVSAFTGSGGGLVPLPHIHEIFLIDCRIAGTTHVEDIDDKTANIDKGTLLMFRREKDNQYDNLAIQILNSKKERIGYVPKAKNEILARLMDAGKLIFGRVEEKEKVDDWIKISIKVFMKDV